MRRGERFNSITHLVGASLALVGLVALVALSARGGDAVALASLGIYGTTLFLLYLMSTLYHSLGGKAKAVFRRFDHVAIYLLIAGTYTPFTLLTLHGRTGWALFAAIWMLALIGVILAAVRPPHYAPAISMLLYVGMGWLCLFALRPMAEALPTAGLAGLFAGGLFYTGGIAFYAAGERMRYGHGIWHLLVLAGSASHYFVILLCVPWG